MIIGTKPNKPIQGRGKINPPKKPGKLVKIKAVKPRY
jgi:hypothetical protein